MREIKFRGKWFDNNEWVYGSYVYYGEKDRHFIVQWNENLKDTPVGRFQFYKVIPETVGQYTGIKDKNGKEIYEGDIVKNHHNIPRKIIFEDSCFVMQDIQKREDGKQYTDFMALYKFIWNDGYEVIGNIYENPELLKEANNGN